MAKKKNKDDYLTIRIDQTVKEKLRKAASAQDRSTSWLAQKLIADFVAAHGVSAK